MAGFVGLSSGRSHGGGLVGGLRRGFSFWGVFFFTLDGLSVLFC